MKKEQLLKEAINKGLITAEANGNIRSLARGRIVPLKGRNVRGYRQIGITINGKRYHYLAHRVIWIYFNMDQSLEGLEINHKNFIKDDNRLENLEPVTRYQNMRHAYEFGGLGERNRKPGSYSSSSKVSWLDAMMMRAMKDLWSTEFMVRKFSISDVSVGKILRNVSYKMKDAPDHIKNDEIFAFAELSLKSKRKRRIGMKKTLAML